MFTNHDGVYLDEDGRPRPLSYAVPLFVPEPAAVWKALPRRARFNVLSHYLSVPANLATAVALVGFGPRFGPGWILIAGLVLAVTCGAQIGLLLIAGRGRDMVRRRLAFAAVNTLVMALTGVALLGVLAAGWWMHPRDGVLGFLVLAVAGLVARDAWTSRFWLAQVRMHGWRIGRR